ncbi:MAG: conjugal transfer protein TraG N-terminal domain-containing protein, partial [Helicobacteraceae bacterium]|nr:conjugal transfer protein TraG N-terminal domain-containing protein [Helicobacteraceae bacterium]
MLFLAATTGIDIGALGFMKPYAERKLQGQFMTSGLLAHEYLPILQMIFTVIIISVSWLLALLAITTANMRYIFMFFWLLLSLVLWLVIASVFNFIFDIELGKAIKNVIYNVNTGGYSILYKSAIDETVGKKLGMLGYLCWLIPVLAFGLAKGSE